MKNKFYIIACLFCGAVLLTACDDDKITPDESLSAPQYDLPKGEAGSLDETIYTIWKDYGTYILYNYEDTDILPLWRGSWAITYTLPEGVPESTDYVKIVVDKINEKLFDVYDDHFIRSYFPYKIMLTSELYQVSTSSTKRDTLNNGQNTFAISNVTSAVASYTDAQWTTFIRRVHRVVSSGYYPRLTPKPVKFIASKAGSMPAASGSPAFSHWTTYNHRAWSSGYVMGRNGESNNTVPVDHTDFDDFMVMLTTTGATELLLRFEYYPKLSDRSLLAYDYLQNTLRIDVIALQNKNCPSDKMASDFFSKLQ